MYRFILALVFLAGSALAAKAAPLDACQDHADHGRKEEARQCYLTALRTNADPAVRAEATWKLGDKKRANELFRAAVAAHPKDAAVRVAWDACSWKPTTSRRLRTSSKRPCNSIRKTQTRIW